MSYFDESYRGWGYERGLPGDKASARKSLASTYQTGKRLAYDIQPAAIEIHGNIAVVHYYFSETVKDVQGKAKDYSGRWTDILMKKGDKWVLIGDHGGRTSKD
jgi:ketosteroid isomerase-like protein